MYRRRPTCSHRIGPPLASRRRRAPPHLVSGCRRGARWPRRHVERAAARRRVLRAPPRVPGRVVSAPTRCLRLARTRGIAAEAVAVERLAEDYAAATELRRRSANASWYVATERAYDELNRRLSNARDSLARSLRAIRRGALQPGTSIEVLSYGEWEPARLVGVTLEEGAVRCRVDDHGTVRWIDAQRVRCVKAT